MSIEELWSIERISEYYAKFATVYDQSIHPDTYPAPFLISSWIIELLLQRNQKCRILDVGCGTGISSSIFFNCSSSDLFEVSGIDATPEMLAKAQKLPFKHLVCGNIEEPFEFQTKFHAILCIGVWEFVSNQEALIGQISNYLENNGLFGVSIPVRESDDEIYVNAFTDLLKNHFMNVVKKECIYGYQNSKTKDIVNYHGFLFQKNMNEI